MKRIAALAAIVITMIAVPAAAATASTTGSAPRDGGPGYGGPGPVQVACHPGYVRGQYKLPAYTQAYPRWHRHARPFRIVCPNIAAKPGPVGCAARQLVFNMAAGSSTLTEVSGPVLSRTAGCSVTGARPLPTGSA